MRGGEALHLTHREFELLRFLAARAGRVVHRGELLRGVWGYPDDSATTRSVDHAIARLRRKIEPQSDQPRFIHTVHGDGYSLTPARECPPGRFLAWALGSGLLALSAVRAEYALRR